MVDIICHQWSATFEDLGQLGPLTRSSDSHMEIDVGKSMMKSGLKKSVCTWAQSADRVVVISDGTLCNWPVEHFKHFNYDTETIIGMSGEGQNNDPKMLLYCTVPVHCTGIQSILGIFPC